MPSSESRARLFVGVLLAALVGAPPVLAQQQAQGFAVERLYPSAPGGGWFAMDSLDMRGGVGGTASLTIGYARNPLRVRASDGSGRLAVVSDEALSDFGLAATYDRFRLYLGVAMPLDVTGAGGAVGGYQFAAPNSGQLFTPSGVNPSTAADALADARLGFDARLIGSASDAFRLGAGAQLLVPSPNTTRGEYITDGTYRAIGRVLVAGDIGPFTYAGQVGVHVRPLDDSPVPGSPQGSELLFGGAGGMRRALCGACDLVLVVGPEFFGATAFRSAFGANTTALEGLLSGRLEGTRDDVPQLRFKLGLGAGINPHFGAPDARLVLGIELFGHNAK
jgi:hypothetical protein